jgi:hypothetical protein
MVQYNSAGAVGDVDEKPLLLLLVETWPQYCTFPEINNIVLRIEQRKE